MTEGAGDRRAEMAEGGIRRRSGGEDGRGRGAAMEEMIYQRIKTYEMVDCSVSSARSRYEVGTSRSPGIQPEARRTRRGLLAWQLSAGL